MSRRKLARFLFGMKVLAICGAAVFMVAGVADCYSEAGESAAGKIDEIQTTEEIVMQTTAEAVVKESTECATSEEPAAEEVEPEYHGLIGSMDWDSEDAYLLAKIAMAEAESEGVEGKALVMLVVLNRVWSDGFPDSISEVIFQEGQFSPVSSGRYDRVEPDQECWEALELIQVEKWDESQGALYFESKGNSSWHRDNLQFLFQYGNHYFYKELTE